MSLAGTPPLQGLTLQTSLYEGFSTEIWRDDAPPGQRSIAIVRDPS